MLAFIFFVILYFFTAVFAVGVFFIPDPYFSIIYNFVLCFGFTVGTASILGGSLYLGFIFQLLYVYFLVSVGALILNSQK